MYQCAINSRYFPKSQNGTGVWTLHPFPTYVSPGFGKAIDIYPSGIICHLICIYFLVLFYHIKKKEHNKTKVLVLNLITSRRQCVLMCVVENNLVCWICNQRCIGTCVVQLGVRIYKCCISGFSLLQWQSKHFCGGF
jgi:hypothetical protein